MIVQELCGALMQIKREAEVWIEIELPDGTTKRFYPCGISWRTTISNTIYAESKLVIHAAESVTTPQSTSVRAGERRR